MLGLTLDKLLILAVIAVVVLGPDRLPRYAARLAGLVRQGKRLLLSAQGRVREELGPEFDEVDWRSLDPRQYDPRRIVREALAESVAPAGPRARGSAVPLGRVDEEDESEDEPDDDRPEKPVES